MENNDMENKEVLAVQEVLAGAKQAEVVEKFKLNKGAFSGLMKGVRIAEKLFKHGNGKNDSLNDCQNCNCEDNKEDNKKELIAALLEISDLRAEIERLAGHKENLMAKCDRLAKELETAKTDAQDGLKEKEKYQQQLKNNLSSLQAEVEKTSRLESAIKQVQSSLDTERANRERIESEMDTAKKELSEAYNQTGIPVWLIAVFVLVAVALFLLGTWL